MAGLRFDLIVADPLDQEVGRFQVRVGNHHYPGVMRGFDIAQHGTFFVEQEGAHGHRHLGLDFAGALLHHLFFDQAQNAQRQGFHIADMALTITARADDAGSLAEAGTQPLTGQFQQPEARNAAQLNSGAVRFQGVAHAVFHFALVAGRPHIDEVHHDQAADIPQPQLSGDLVGGFQVGLQGGFLDVRALGGTGGVDVDGHQCFGGIDNDGAAGRQFHFPFERGLDLGFDLETGEQRDLLVIEFDLVLVVGHHLLDEGLGFLEHLFGVDQHLADVLAQVVADGADDDIGFLIDQERGFAGLRCFGNGIPQFEQVIQVPLQFLGATAKTGGAHDHAHFVGQFEAGQSFLELLPFLTLDTAGNAAGAWIVGHQHQIPAGQADEGGQGGAFVAALFLVHLDDHFLAFLDHILDVDATLDVLGILGEVLTGNFLQRQKTMAFGAEVHESGFKRGFNASDLAFVDIGFFLLAGAVFDIQVIKTLAVHQGHPNLFGMGGVDQHTFHCATTLFRGGMQRAGLVPVSDPDPERGKAAQALTSRVYGALRRGDDGDDSACSLLFLLRI